MREEKIKFSKESYAPEILGVLIGIGVLTLWYFSSLAIDKAVVPSSFQSIITICGSAFGAFFGAYCAFKLRQHEENQTKRNKRKTALDLCLFTMARQHNAIRLMKKDYDEYPQEFQRAFMMPAAKPPEYKDLKLNLEDLIFLTDHESVEDLFHLSIEQERFEQVVFAVNNRNTYTVEHLQPQLAKKELNGKTVSPKELQSALGDVVFKTAITAANTANDLLAAAEESIVRTQNRLHEIAKSLYPDDRFLKVDASTSSEAENVETAAK